MTNMKERLARVRARNPNDVICEGCHFTVKTCGCSWGFTLYGPTTCVVNLNQDERVERLRTVKCLRCDVVFQDCECPRTEPDNWEIHPKGYFLPHLEAPSLYAKGAANKSGGANPFLTAGIVSSADGGFDASSGGGGFD